MNNEEIPDPNEEEPEPRLYAGKYKTVEDMEAAYQEAQAAMTRAQQEAAGLRESRNYAGPPQNPPVAEEAVDAYNTQFFENPYQAQVATMEAMRQTFQADLRAYNAGIRKAMSAKRADVLFAQVQDEYEAELAGMTSDQLSDKNTVDAVYDIVLGRHARKVVQEAGSDPKARTTMLKQLGVTEPEPTPLTGGANEPSAVQVDALRRMGLTGKQIEAAVKRVQETTGE